MRILVAEDEVISRVRLVGALRGAGHDVIAVGDGNEAWNVLEANDPPSLAVIDWLMPGLDGIEICRRVRQRSGMPYVYVIMLTSNGEQDDMVAGLDAGADDYLVKPCKLGELQARLRVGQRMLALQEALRTQATLDALTGVLNRGAILPLLDREIARRQREPGPLSIVMVDVDHFKQINDRHGHPAGDAVLRETTRRIHDLLRPYDLIGRIGGEEFLIVLPGCRGSDAGAIAERLRVSLCATPMAAGGSSLPVAASFGVATLGDGVAASQLIALADRALYASKHSGRNRVTLASALDGERLAS